MSSEIHIAFERIRGLRERVRQIEDLVRWQRPVPRDLQLDDKEMVALEKHIGVIAAAKLGVPEVDQAIWRPFWHAAYEEWDRSEGAARFWEEVNRHLASTQEFLMSLGAGRSPKRRRAASSPSKTSPGSSRATKAVAGTQTVRSTSGIRVFISHSSADADIAAALIDLLRVALNLPARDVRCTSVDGYRLPGGASTDEQLRQEVHESVVFIGLISEQSMASSYVVFELGARWGAGRQLIPLLAPGTASGQLGGPLRGINALSCDRDAQLHQLVSEVAEALGIQSDVPSSYQEKIERLRSCRREAG